MATNKLQLTFTGAATADDYILFYITTDGVPVSHGETFKASRTEVGEAEIGTDATTQAELYAEALRSDYPSLGVSVSGAEVTVSSTIGLPIFGLDISGSAVTGNLLPVSVGVSGLESNRYLINNPVIINIGTGEPTDYYRVNIINNSNGKTTGDIILYPDIIGNSELDIAPYLKGIFQMPSDANGYSLPDQPTTNANNITLQVYLPADNETPSFETTKTFIRGGRKTNNTNITLPSNPILRPSVKLPVWAGFDTAEYYLDGSVIRKRLVGQVDPANIDMRRSKGCNRTYVKFLNQSGGYSNWMFDSYTETDGNTNQGTYIRNQKIEDIGNESNSGIKVFGKVPQEYVGIIKELIISPEIYVLDEGEYVRVTSARNSITSDSVKTGYYVTVNLDYKYRFNPTTAWSNS